MKEIELSFVSALKREIEKNQPLMQVVVGPRQVGKTTGVKSVLSQYNPQTYYYKSADGEIARPSSWIIENWNLAQTHNKNSIFVIDEIQKVENWSEVLKKLWDEQKNKKDKLKVIILGSSSLQIQKGLSESLTGRFFLHNVYQWSFEESMRGYNISLDEYLIYGGYPGSYEFYKNKTQWLNFMKESIINPVIGKDILSQARVKSPALFRQCFDLICAYPAQEISYTKLLGQLQDKGNTDLIKYYLELFEGAYLIKCLSKYSNKKVLTRSSSPKILPLCPSLYSVSLDADLGKEEIGRSFELMIGALLARLPGKLYYWREKNKEVDFVYQFGKKITAIEVKSGRSNKSLGLEAFKNKFAKSEIKIITRDNFIVAINQLAEV